MFVFPLQRYEIKIKQTAFYRNYSYVRHQIVCRCWVRMNVS